MKIRIWLEHHLNKGSTRSPILEQKCILHHFEKSISLLHVFSVSQFHLMLLFRALRKAQDSFRLLALLNLAQGLTRDAKQSVQRPRFGFNHFSGFLLAIYFLIRLVAPPD